ncbi:Calx-beta domain-containing protein [Tautonia plasticadhaerens]|uniref:Calx-beta domain-containing protein n=1 Tax=Tautonia plasticadhaerens TaxID=2527974 RepID=UPI0018D24E69|nr:Calx-beta domain-containing protein [Tautonia plasticadhaerens]
MEGRVLLSLNFDPGVDPSVFRVTTFASGLDYPYGMTQLVDGSLLVATSRPASTSYFNSTGQLLRLSDADGDGVADGPGAVLYGGLPGALTSIERAGDLILVVSSQDGGERISVLRTGASPSDPLRLAGSIRFAIPPGFEHKVFALETRATPGSPGSYDLFFNLGAAENFAATTETVRVSGLIDGTLRGDSLYRVTVSDGPGGLSVSGLTRIASGLRNAAGIAVHPASGDLYFEDNGIDTPSNRIEPLSADELNRVAAADVGGAAEDFGFPSNYTAYRTGTLVGGAGVQPVVAFQPIPDPRTGAESEGPAEIAIAPSAFPPGFNDGVFVGFHGQFNLAGAANEENPVVYYDLGSGDYVHFIRGDSPGVGHLDGLLATADSLFLADLSSVGSIGSGAGSGVIYQIRSLPTPGPDLPEIEVRDGSTIIPDGAGSVSFGATALGSAVSKTFTVSNVGSSPLTLSAPVSVPEGFRLASGFPETVIAPGASTTFSVELTAQGVGTFSGMVSFGNDDADESPFEFSVSGIVTSQPAALPLASIDDITVTEGGRGSTAAVFTVSLSRAAPAPVSIDFSVEDGSARRGTDYRITTTSPLVIPAGRSSGTIAVEVIDDAIDEEEELFSVVLSGGVNAVIDRAEGSATILDDDPPPEVSIGASTASIAERGGQVTVTARSSSASGRAVVIRLDYGGSATLGADYSASQPSITIPSGSTSGTLTLSAVADDRVEGPETIEVRLAAVEAGIPATASPLVVTIIDGRPPGVVADFDGDRRTDFTVYSPAAGDAPGRFSRRLSSGDATTAVDFGNPGDFPIAGDYDGDGIADLAVYGYDPSLGYARFLVRRSSDGSTYSRPFGGPFDFPIAGDYDGDGTTDLAVYGYSPLNGFSRYAVLPSGGSPAVLRPLGGRDDFPVAGDYDGDGRDDFAVFGYSPQDGYSRFGVVFSGGGPTLTFPFGGRDDRPLQGDYDGDGTTDLAVFGYSPDEGFARFGVVSSSGRPTRSIPFGGRDDRPVAGDYDGDGATDLAVYGFSPDNGFARFGVIQSSGAPTITLPAGDARSIGLPPFSGLFRIQDDPGADVSRSSVDVARLSGIEQLMTPGGVELFDGDLDALDMRRRRLTGRSPSRG